MIAFVLVASLILLEIILLRDNFVFGFYFYIIFDMNR